MNKTEQMTLKYVTTILTIVVLFIVMFIFVASRIQGAEIIAFDQVIIDYIQSFESDATTEWTVILTDLGSIKFIAVAVVVGTVLLCLYRKFSLAAFLICAPALGGLLNKFLKWIFKRERPDILPLITEHGYSFPSGHSMGSLIFYGSAAYVFLHIWKTAGKKAATIIIACLVILMIGISRIYLGVHYPTDVVGGFAVGFAFLLVCILVFRYYEERKNK
ncbi:MULTISPECIES: phosphatase PAP2 family protein [Bacillaceae]|uniref:phosphatase PAP2 family protein n=1 Tax=Bacillaceae TaxID=186817 RepID=UPI001E43E388|nr:MULTISPECIES: phosphatase PAP2 family protein [Bacillaceae]MCE4047370.1 phosphatase PAP2 family protein [Bacillus sp. Au-Bac7]MCM3030649.1 phosphatase PAP2 family protein [Niallia sp. MER 6]